MPLQLPLLLQEARVGPGGPAHVVADLMLRCIIEQPDSLTVWGTGAARRELLYVDDAAKGVLSCVNGQPGAFYNIGTGQDVSIYKLATSISAATGLNAPIVFDSTRPDGQLLKVMEVSKAAEELNWQATTPLASGLTQTAKWYLKMLRSGEVI